MVVPVLWCVFSGGTLLAMKAGDWWIPWTAAALACWQGQARTDPRDLHALTVIELSFKPIVARATALDRIP
jgi:hypothetical protein